jgi:hypothetical protein
MVTKVQHGRQIQKSSDLGEIWFPSRLWCCELNSIVGLYSYKVDHNMDPKPWISIPYIKIYLETKYRPNRSEIWFPSRLWCCELIFIVGLLWCLELDETFQKFCLTCVHIILRLRNLRIAY